MRLTYALLFLAIATICLSQGSQRPAPTPAKVGHPKQEHPQATQQKSETDERGTEQFPLVVEEIPAANTQEEAAQQAKERQQRASHDWWLIFFSGVLAIVAVFQLIVYGFQSWKLQQTVKAAKEQSEAMERHIGEASRSANATEQIVGVIQEGNEAIMRSYLSVIMGSAIFQQRTENIKFEGKPTLVNTGSTPARNVEIRIAAEIVPFAKAETFDYPLPPRLAKAKAPDVCAPHQSYILSAVVIDFVPDADVPDIKQGIGKNGALTIWGTVTYDDIFGKRHTTKFGQWLFWYPNGTPYGYYIPGQNDMD